MSNDSYPQRPATVIFAPGERVRVLLPLPLAEAYEYRVHADLTLKLGDFVEVPLGRRVLTGIVWGPELVASRRAGCGRSGRVWRYRRCRK